MTLIVSALRCEAKPLIRHFGLKKDTNTAYFDIYGNGELSLIISGPGVIKSAVATTYLLARTMDADCIQVFNIGICGSASRDIEIGSPVLFNKIINYTTGRAFYPDIVINHCFNEGTLFSFPAPVSSNAALEEKVSFVDMEAAGFFEASMSFIPPHNIYCLKMVSDYLDGEKMEPEFVEKIIDSNISNIQQLIDAAKTMPKTDKDILSPSENKLLLSISNNLRLTFSMKHQLRKLAEEYKIRSGKGLESLEFFLSAKADSKSERKRVFDEIRRLLEDR